MTEEQLQEAFKQAQSLALIPVLKLLADCTGVDMSNKVGVNLDTLPGHISISNDKIKFKAWLDIVPNDYNILDNFNESGIYEKKLDTFKDDEMCNVITHILKCAFVVFNQLRSESLALEIAEHQLNMDDQTCLHLNEYPDTKLSVKFSLL
jgi:hypothetical protein